MSSANYIMMYFKILRCITLAMAGLQWSIKILANHSRYAAVEIQTLTSVRD